MTPTALVVTSSPDLIEEVRAAGAAAGVPVRTVAATEAPARWPVAATVVVGPDALAAWDGRPRATRPGVLVASVGELPPALWPRVLDVGAERVLELPRDRGPLVEALGRSMADADALVVGVVGGRGGAGASVVSARLAAAFAADGARVLALDADPDGPGLDVVLAMEQEPGARWSGLVSVDEALPAASLRDALPTRASLAVLAHDVATSRPPTPDELLRLLDSARAAYDVVVVDLPRGREQVLAELAPRCAELLVVVTSDVCGAAAATRVLRRLGPDVAARLVVREVPGSDLAPDELVGWLGVPAAAELPHDARLAAAIDQGAVPSTRSRWSRTVRDLARRLAADHRRAA